MAHPNETTDNVFENESKPTSLTIVNTNASFNTTRTFFAKKALSDKTGYLCLKKGKQKYKIQIEQQQQLSTNHGNFQEVHLSQAKVGSNLEYETNWINKVNEIVNKD